MAATRGYRCGGTKLVKRNKKNPREKWTGIRTDIFHGLRLHAYRCLVDSNCRSKLGARFDRRASHRRVLPVKKLR